MRDIQAHPVFDQQERVAVFHNGFVTNFKELAKELHPNRDSSKTTQSDSELIALTLGHFLDQGMDIKTAITTMVETKLIGTWRLAIILCSEPDKVYVTKNAGPFYMGTSENSVVFCSDSSIVTEQSEVFTFKKIKNNVLYTVTDECVVDKVQLEKKIDVTRKPRRGYNHIF